MTGPKLSVIFITYNHEKYVEKALRSVCEQETDFAYEIVVGEDCSTDSTREILKKVAAEYPDKGVHQNTYDKDREDIDSGERHNDDRKVWDEFQYADFPDLGCGVNTKAHYDVDGGDNDCRWTRNPDVGLELVCH